MTTDSPVDPSDIKVPIENLVKKVDKMSFVMCGIHVLDEKKTSYPVNCIWHMLEAGRIPSIDDLSDDDDGNIIISEVDPESLNMSSQD